MTTNKFKIYQLIIIVILAIPLASNAQYSNMLYHMSNLPQANNLNPAVINDSSKIVVGLPALGGLSAGITSDFSLNDFITIDKAMYISFDDLYHSIPSVGGISQSLAIPLLTFQFRTSNKLFSFSLTERTNFGFAFDKEFINLISKGNSAYLGNNVFQTNFNIDVQAYHEIALGYTHENVIEGLTIGGKLKLLSGIAGMHTENTMFELHTNEDWSSNYIKASGDINFGIPITVETNTDGSVDTFTVDLDDPVSLATQFSNLGFGLDLGAQYQINDEIVVSASVIDLGMINFNNNITNLEQNGDFEWKGIDISELVGSEDSETPEEEQNQFEELMDSAMGVMNIKDNNDPFSSALPTKVYIGGSYRVNEMLTAGLVDRISFYNGKIRNSLTLSGNLQVGKALSFSAAYSVVGNSYNNLGLGTSIKLGPIQLFMIADNVLGLASVGGAQHLNASFGINMMFGNKNY